MNKIHAKKIDSNKIILNKQNPISFDNGWGYESNVKASFGIGHDNKNIYLSYGVQESNTRAIYTEINQSVWEDSCVEFFISFDGENYYNLEFNCIGNVLVGYGTSNKDKRILLEKNVIEQIKTNPSLGRDKIDIVNTNTAWELDIVIPISVFTHTEIDNLDGKNIKCNFYKCGDKQEVVHFLSWNKIQNTTPNFHLPEYFGEVEFNS